MSSKTAITSRSTSRRRRVTSQSVEAIRRADFGVQNTLSPRITRNRMLGLPYWGHVALHLAHVLDAPSSAPALL